MKVLFIGFKEFIGKDGCYWFNFGLVYEDFSVVVIYSIE